MDDVLRNAAAVIRMAEKVAKEWPEPRGRMQKGQPVRHKQHDHHGVILEEDIDRARSGKPGVHVRWNDGARSWYHYTDLLRDE